MKKILVGVLLLGLTACATNKVAGYGLGVTTGCLAAGGSAGAIVWQDRKLAAGIGCATGAITGALFTNFITDSNARHEEAQISDTKAQLEREYNERLIKVMEAGQRKPTIAPKFVDEKVQDGRYMPPRVDWEIEEGEKP